MPAGYLYHVSTADATAEAESGFIDFFRALADGERLRVAASIVPAPLSRAGVAAATGLPVSTASRHLSRLVTAGLIVVEGTGSDARYRWDDGRVQALATQLGSPRLRARAGRTDERSKVLAAFFRDGRLTGLPASEGRRRIVLVAIAEKFDADRTYTEREVNAIIKPLYDDYTQIRRALVDAHLFNRSDGVYWRGEGEVEGSGQKATGSGRSGR